MRIQCSFTSLVIIATILLYGCNSQVNPDNGPPSISPPSTSNQTLFWKELQGRFYTKDLARAQKEIPFPILLPTYLPDNEYDIYLPDIDGPLKRFHSGDRIRVNERNTPLDLPIGQNEEVVFPSGT